MVMSRVGYILLFNSELTAHYPDECSVLDSRLWFMHIVIGIAISLDCFNIIYYVINILV